LLSAGVSRRPTLLSPITGVPATPDPTPPEPLAQAIKGCCPRCGEGALFAGWVSFAPRCSRCGLDFTAFNVGDGPAAFLILIVGTLVTVLALTLELSASPPWWLHLLLWTPLTLVLVIGSLRIAKAALLAVEYRREAREGRLTRDLP
jgi:uncharacterized protein (DUF983 family)